MLPPKATPVVHLELHTPEGREAEEFYRRLCRWQPECIDLGNGAYHALDLGNGLGGGIVECGSAQPMWLPYVEVSNIFEATEQARLLGAAILLEPREGPAGWRSVVSTPAAGQVALWQQKH